MDRQAASKLLRETLDKYELKDWAIRLVNSPNFPLGRCSHQDMCIFLNTHHIDTHPDPEIQDTILHEVAHALVDKKHGHDATWTTKAREIGVNNLSSCGTIGLDPRIIDAIRSGHSVEVTFEEDTIKRNITVEEKVFRPKYQVTRLQERCPECNKVAIEKFAFDAVDREGNQIKLITLECFHIIKRVIPKGTPFELMISNDWKEEIKNCKHEWPTKEEAKEKHIASNQCKKCQEYKLYNFQIIGARFAESALVTQKGCLIADDMGLGKTVQALAVLKYHGGKGKKYKKVMVVTKSAIKFQWFKQAVRWLGPEWISQIISTSRDYLMPGLNLYIIPYDLLRRFPREKLHALGIELVILDEVQQIKNPDSSRTQEVRKLVSANDSCRVIELSGTPWKNRGSEFFPALNLIDPVKFYSYQAYLDRWVDYYYQGNSKKMGGIKNPDKFREYTESLIIRREYEEVMDEFPEVNRTKLNIQLDELQQETYDETISDFVAWYNEAVIGGTEEQISGIEILAKLSRARHVTGLAKIPASLGFAERFVEDTDRKLVIFVHHKDVGQLMYNALTNRNKATNPEWYELAQACLEEGVKIFKYTSAETGKPEGYQIQEDFNKTKRAIMVASTLACGEGLDLQTCADTIMHERQWNPQNEDQAAPGRFRRIGQKYSTINITFPEAEGTIDEYLDGMVAAKRHNFHVVMNKSEAIKWSEDSIGKELAKIIVAKHKEKRVKNGKSIEKPTVSLTALAAY